MKILFVGLGSIGTRHLKNLTTLAGQKGLTLQLDALRHDLSRPLPQEVSSLLCSQFDRPEALGNYDAVFITNPTQLHFEVIQQLADRTDCFFIEKPLFENCKHTPLQAGLVDKRVYVAAPMRWCGTYIKLKELLAARGDLRPYSARIICSSYLPEWRKGVDYRTVYSARRELGGGVGIDLIHEWDYLIDLFGAPLQQYSFVGKYSDLEIDSDDVAVYIARYPAMLAEIHLDYFGRGYRRSIELMCRDGSVLADFGAGILTLPDGSVQDCTEPLNDRYLREMDYFLTFLQSGQQDSINNAEHAWQVLQYALGTRT